MPFNNFILILKIITIEQFDDCSTIFVILKDYLSLNDGNFGI